MANEYTNDSYNRCIAELRTRYRGRAVSNNAKNEAAHYAQLDKEEKALAPESYIMFDSRSKIADSYRSGVYNGSKYMTSDDFVRYFKSRRAFYMPPIVKPEEAKRNSAVPARKNGASGSLTSSESGSKEGHIRTLLSTVKKLFVKWFPIETKENRQEGRRFRIPVSALTGIAAFAISTTLIVSGSVMLGSATGDVGRLDSEIATLKSEKSELEGEFDMKYTIEQLEADAKGFGMIKREYAESSYIKLEEDEKVVIYDEDDESERELASLLSAFGIKLKD